MPVKATVILADESARDRRVTVEWAGPATLGQMLTAASLPVRPNRIGVAIGDGVGKALSWL